MGHPKPHDREHDDPDDVGARARRNRFRIARVDYHRQKRIIKGSGEWHANVIKSNSVAWSWDQAPDTLVLEACYGTPQS